MSSTFTLENTIKQLTKGNGGILAADESHPTLKKRFAAFNIDYNPQTQREYRELLFKTPELEEYINGVILFEETLTQKDSQQIPLIESLIKKGIVPGIKVDKGLMSLPFHAEEKITQGLDGLSKRLKSYSQEGLRFAKWRATFTIQENKYPSSQAISSNAELLALYAAYCQQEAMVPIIEPEVLLEGTHSLQTCQTTTQTILQEVFKALEKYQVLLEYIILKPNMVTAGNQYKAKMPDVQAVAKATLEVFTRTVPASVASINFLSGGHTPFQATAYLEAINSLPATKPWRLNFSYSRALQLPALEAWKGLKQNEKAAQQALYQSCKQNVEAITGIHL